MKTLETLLNDCNLTTIDGITNIAKYSLKRRMKEFNLTLDEALKESLKTDYGNSDFWHKKAAMELWNEEI